MTIKRRLFISNILMLTIPLLLTIFTALILLFVYLTTEGVNGFDSLDKRRTLNEAISQVEELSSKWIADIEKDKIKNDVDAFNNSKSSAVILYVYEGSESLFPDLILPENDITDMVLSQDYEVFIIRGNSATYCIKSETFTLILIDSNYSLSDIRGDNFNTRIGIVTFAVLIVLVFITSRLLTRSVLSSISKPINILGDGVQQIRDGNLAHRIEYGGKDEFSSVCSDFNEMAQRLTDSVEQRQRDEKNRKELIAGVSHDLRTPLTSIKAYLEGIEKGVASTPQIQSRYFEIIKAKTMELEQIINQLFLFSKIDIGEFPFKVEETDLIRDLKGFIADITGEYEKKGLNIAFSHSDETAYVNIDKLQFRNVLINIIGNSLKYKIKEQAELDISYTIANGKITLKLRDDGEGVPPDSLDKIFNVFYRCDPSRSNAIAGSGLGLAIAAKVIERLGGTIAAKNADCGGLIILITLPLIKGEIA